MIEGVATDPPVMFGQEHLELGRRVKSVTPHGLDGDMARGLTLMGVEFLDQLGDQFGIGWLGRADPDAGRWGHQAGGRAERIVKPGSVRLSGVAEPSAQ